MGFEAAFAVIAESFAAESAAGTLGAVGATSGAGVTAAGISATEAALAASATAAGASGIEGFGGGGFGGEEFGGLDGLSQMGTDAAGTYAPGYGGAGLPEAGFSAAGSSFGDMLSSAAKGIFSPIGGGFGNVAGMPIGVSPFDIGKGAYGLYQSDKMRQMAGQRQASADPNAPYRAGYAGRLNALSLDPSSIVNVPGYAAGEQAVQRSMAAQGYQGSGNMREAVSNYGGNFYNQEMQRLMQLSGGNPGQAAQIGMEGDVNAMNLAGQSLNSLGYGAAGGAGRRNVSINY